MQGHVDFVKQSIQKFIYLLRGSRDKMMKLSFVPFPCDFKAFATFKMKIIFMVLNMDILTWYMMLPSSGITDQTTASNQSMLLLPAIYYYWFIEIHPDLARNFRIKIWSFLQTPCAYKTNEPFPAKTGLHTHGYYSQKLKVVTVNSPIKASPPFWPQAY